jgi:hypothetical protein
MPNADGGATSVVGPNVCRHAARRAARARARPASSWYALVTRLAAAAATMIVRGSVTSTLSPGRERVGMAQVRLNADARRFRNFCREYLVFVEGSVAGQPVEFEAWLLGITNELLSRGPDGRRRYTSAYIGLAKKNNKSTFGAALALYFLVVESARSARRRDAVYAIAASKDQAKIVFGHAKAMVEASPLLSDYSDRSPRHDLEPAHGRAVRGAVGRRAEDARQEPVGRDLRRAARARERRAVRRDVSRR